LKVYIDADDDVWLSWKVIKQLQLRGDHKEDPKWIEAFLDKYEKIEKPSFEKHIEPSKKFADIIIPNYGFSIDAMDVEKQLVSMPAVNLLLKEIERRVYF